MEQDALEIEKFPLLIAAAIQLLSVGTVEADIELSNLPGTERR